jgi:hypothetical protein
MSERFDDLLSEVVDSAASTARKPGAAAARKRGRQRLNRQRLAASALSLALLGGAGSIAAVSLNHGAGVPSTNGIGSASPTGSGSPSAATSPTATPSASSSPSSGSSATGTTTDTTQGSSTNTNSAPNPNPHTYVTGAWLAAGQLPFGGQLAWQASVPTVDKLSGNVAEATTPSGPNVLDYSGDVCGVPGLQTGVTGFQYDLYYAPSGGNKVDGALTASNTDQKIFFYPGSVTATTAWSSISSGLAACATSESGTVTGVTEVGTVREVSSSADSQCWSNFTSSTPGQYQNVTNICFVRDGDLIEAASVRLAATGASPIAYDFTQIDTHLVQELTDSAGAQLSGS